MLFNLWIKWYKSKNPIPQKSAFSASSFQNEKKLPGGTLFMHTKSFDHNTFCTALHWHMKDVYLCPFIYLFVKIIIADLWITY